MSDDPIVGAVKAAFRPFDVLKGVAAPLADGRPSQKFMAKAINTVTLTSGQGMCFMQCPNVASDATRPSVVMAIGAFTNGQFATNGSWSNTSVGNLLGPFGVIRVITTNTPYDAGMLSSGFEYSCVGAGLKFTYEGAELYRGGTMRYIYDTEAAFNNNADWTIATVNDVIDFVNTSPNTIRQSINHTNVVEINATPARSTYLEASFVNSTSYSVGSNAQTEIGGTTSSTIFNTNPGVLGYYVNTSGNSISFHVDVVEHWSISNQSIQALQTPSHAHSAMDTHVIGVMANTRQQHASMPNTTHSTVSKTILSAMKSPIGLELLHAGIRAALA